MSLIVDTSGLLALFNRADPDHVAVSAAVTKERGPFVVSPFVVAEVDYLVATRLGVDAELAVLGELAGPAYVLAPFDESDLANARQVVDTYRDQQVGVADASLVVLADRYQTRRVLTLDRRHFTVLRTPNGDPLEVIPGPN